MHRGRTLQVERAFPCQCDAPKKAPPKRGLGWRDLRL